MNYAFTAHLEELDSLRGACRKRPKLAAFLALELRDLDTSLKELRDTKARQLVLTTEKEQATAACNNLVRQTSDLALRIRAGVRAVLGPRNPQLREFRIAPLKKQGAR